MIGNFWIFCKNVEDELHNVDVMLVAPNKSIMSNIGLVHDCWAFEHSPIKCARLLERMEALVIESWK